MAKSIKYRLTGGIAGEFDSVEAAAAAVEKQSSHGEYVLQTVICVKPAQKPGAPAKPGVKPAPSASLDAIRAQLATKAKK